MNQAADIRRYNRIILQPVQLWRIPGDREQLTEEQRQLVTNTFYAALRRELEKDFQLVSQPGPTTMVLATAVTQAREGANPVLSTVSTFVPQTRLVREGVSLMTGSDPMVGGAAGELKVTDSMTGELLGAAVDSRDATAGTRVRTSSWDDVQTVTTYWAQLVRYRLCRVQQRPGCQLPGATS